MSVRQPDSFSSAGRPQWEDVAGFSVEWYRLWRAWHLERFPDVDDVTRRNLDMLCEPSEASA